MRAIFLIVLITALLTGGVAGAQVSECRFTGTLETLALRHAPLTNPFQIKDQLPGGFSYPVLASHGEHFLIAVDDRYDGWVDRRSGNYPTTARLCLPTPRHWKIFRPCASSTRQAQISRAIRMPI